MLRLARLAAWAALAAIVVLTFVPPGLRPMSGVPHGLEHLLAFLLVGAGFAFGYPQRRVATALAAILVTGLLELLQVFVPGRHARLSDFVVDALGACLGVALVAIVAPAEGAHEGR